jgi:hypothetical protein
LKSVIDDGSTFGPKEPLWNVTPLTVKLAVVGLGNRPRWDSDTAEPAVGHSRSLPSEAPAAATAAPPMKARRDGP